LIALCGGWGCRSIGQGKNQLHRQGDNGGSARPEPCQAKRAADLANISCPRRELFDLDQGAFSARLPRLLNENAEF
jgi:hypothetical protein